MSLFTKKYFQDRAILLLNTIVVLLAVFSVLVVVFKIDTSQTVAILRYQAELGLAGYQRAAASELYSFAIAGVLFATTGVLLAARLYHIKRAFSLTCLWLSALVILLNIIVSFSILSL